MRRGRLGALLGAAVLAIPAAGSVPAGAANDEHRATYATATPATAHELASDVRILTLRFHQLGFHRVHLAVSRQRIVVTDAGHAVSSSAISEVAQVGRVLFRPVLCTAPPYQTVAGAAPVSGADLLPTCGAPYANGIEVNPTSSVEGYSSITLGPDPQFANYTDTPVDTPGYSDRAVLVPALPLGTDHAVPGRYVAGPSQMSGSSVKSARATKDQTGQWVVNYTMTPGGASLWDAVAKKNFHQLLAIELDGVIFSAPIIQPTQSSFTSFDGQGEISGDLDQADARLLALDLNTKPLAVGLRLLRSSP
ncbi:MAG TPA: hypothetical protein VGL48_07275 [Acidimicrobiales bacterium]